MPNEHAEEQRSQSNDNEHETHQLDPTSREATIATTEEPKNEQQRQWLRKIKSLQFFKKSLVDTAWQVRNVNFCIQPHAENIWKTPKEVAEHNARELRKYSMQSDVSGGWRAIQNSANILGPQGNVTMIGASEYILRAQGTSKPHLQSRYQVQLLEQQSMIATQNLSDTPHLACHCHSPCRLTNSLLHPTPYTISHHPSDNRSTVPLSPTTPCYPLYNQLILNS